VVGVLHSWERRRWKSTLIGRLVELIRKKGEPVAVLCCDPESPVRWAHYWETRAHRRAGEDRGLFCS